MMSNHKRIHKESSSRRRGTKEGTSIVVGGDKELVPLHQEMGLYLKEVSKMTMTVQLPKVKLPGQCISTAEVMEKLKKKVKPHAFKSLAVLNNTIEFIRFQAEFESKIVMDLVMSKLNRLLLKTSTFQEGVKIKCAELKLGSSKHEWESYFRDNPKMDEKKPGYRPDTIHIKNLPLKWFGGNRPNTSMLLDAFKSFGEIKRFHIPLLDEMELMAINNSFRKFSHSESLVFEAFIMYKDYVSFVKAMEVLKGMKLVVKRGHYAPLEYDIIVDFDKTKHLSDKAIKKRKLDKEYGIQNSEEVKQLKEETKRQREAYEERISQLTHRKNQAKSLIQLIFTKLSEKEEEAKKERKRLQQEQEERQRQRQLQEKREEEEKESSRNNKEKERREEVKSEKKNVGERNEIVSSAGDRVTEDEETGKKESSSSFPSNPTVVVVPTPRIEDRPKASGPLRSFVASTVRVSSLRKLDDDSGDEEGDTSKQRSSLRSTVVQSKRVQDEEDKYNDRDINYHDEHHSRNHRDDYYNGGVRRDVDKLPLPPGVYEYVPGRDRYEDHYRHSDHRRREDYSRSHRSRDHYNDDARYGDNEFKNKNPYDEVESRYPYTKEVREDISRSREGFSGSRHRRQQEGRSPSLPLSTSSSRSDVKQQITSDQLKSPVDDIPESLEKESEMKEEATRPSKEEKAEDVPTTVKRKRITFDTYSPVKQHKVVKVTSSTFSKPRLLITTTNDRLFRNTSMETSEEVREGLEDHAPASKRSRILVKFDSKV